MCPLLLTGLTFSHSSYSAVAGLANGAATISHTSNQDLSDQQMVKMLVANGTTEEVAKMAVSRLRSKGSSAVSGESKAAAATAEADGSAKGEQGAANEWLALARTVVAATGPSQHCTSFGMFLFLKPTVHLKSGLLSLMEPAADSVPVHH